MNPSKELALEWANQAHNEVTNADLAKAGGSTRIAVNIRIAELAAAWGAEQSLDGKRGESELNVLLSAIDKQVGNGMIPWPIEDAYAAYEAAMKGEQT